MQTLLKYAGVVALAIIVLIGLAKVLTVSGVKFGTAVDCTSVTCFTTVGVLTSFQDDGTAIFNGAVTLASTLATTGSIKVGASGSTVSGFNFGSCAIWANATTIAASTTKQVDCSSTGRSGGTLAGITAAQEILAMATTSISTKFGGVQVVAAHASSTAGYITLKLYNATGAAFTWTGAASSTIQYIGVK